MLKSEIKRLRSWEDKNKKSQLLIFCSLLLTAYCLLFTATADAQPVGKITTVEGRVDILRAGTTVAVPVKMGDAVNVGDILRTKSDGKAEITFIDNTVMTVGPRSRLGIDEYLYKPAEEKRAAALRLYRGRTGFKIPRPVYPAEGSKFEMKTRTAVAGVRGTEGILYTDGIERVYVMDGLIEFTTPLGTVMVAAGRVGEVFYGRVPTERPFTPREYEQQQRQISPMPPAEAPPADLPPPVAAMAAPPISPLVAAPPPPPPGLEPPPPPAFVTVPALRAFTASAGILDGEIEWMSMGNSGTAAVIQSGSVSGTFNHTILEGGYYRLNMSGSYAWVGGRSVDPSPDYAIDDWFYFFYSGSADGKPFYGASVGEILWYPYNHLWDPANHVDPDKLWYGGNLGWIEDGPRKYWYIGELSGNYSNIFYNYNTGSRAGQSGTFSATSAGFFWDDSIPFWAVLDNIVPTLPDAVDFFVPITETALRIYDISGSGALHIFGPGPGLPLGEIATTISGTGIELTPGSGLFDVNVTGTWGVHTDAHGAPVGSFSDFTDIKGTIHATTSITGPTVYDMEIAGGIAHLDSNTAIVGADVAQLNDIDISGVMVGKMTATTPTTGTLDAKAIGEVWPGFLLP